MSKTFNLLYVFAALLLQFFSVTSQAQSIIEAQQHKTLLIKKHGLIHSPILNNNIHNILNRMMISSDCQVLDSDTVNAFALSDGSLIISLGLLKLTQNPDQMAHIMAHEYAHFELNHHQQLTTFTKKPPLFFPKKKLQKLRKKQEQAADEWANKRLQTYGLDPNQVHHLWQQLSQSEKLQKWSDHSQLSHRINKQSLQAPLSIDGVWQQMIHDLSQR